MYFCFLPFSYSLSLFRSKRSVLSYQEFENVLTNLTSLLFRNDFRIRKKCSRFRQQRTFRKSLINQKKSQHSPKVSFFQESLNILKKSYNLSKNIILGLAILPRRFFWKTIYQKFFSRYHNAFLLGAFSFTMFAFFEQLIFSSLTFWATVC